MMQSLEDYNQYWLIRTKQIWKVGIFFLLILVILIMLIAKIMIINKVLTADRINELELALGEIIVGFGTLIWFSQSIRCPLCGYKPVWPILRSAPASEWLRRIVKLEKCPSCKDQMKNEE